MGPAKRQASAATHVQLSWSRGSEKSGRQRHCSAVPAPLRCEGLVPPNFPLVWGRCPFVWLLWTTWGTQGFWSSTVGRYVTQMEHTILLRPTCKEAPMGPRSWLSHIFFCFERYWCHILLRNGDRRKSSMFCFLNNSHRADFILVFWTFLSDCLSRRRFLSLLCSPNTDLVGGFVMLFFLHFLPPSDLGNDAFDPQVAITNQRFISLTKLQIWRNILE